MSTAAVSIGLALLVATVAWGLVRPSRPAVMATAAAAVVWLFVDDPLEGSTVMRLTMGHGVTQGDLLGVLAFLISGLALRRSRRRRPAGTVPAQRQPPPAGDRDASSAPDRTQPRN